MTFDNGGSGQGARWVTVDSQRAGQRLDNFLLAQLKGVPRSRVYRMLRKGEVRVNGGRTRAGRRLQAGDRVRLPPVSGRSPEASAAVPESLRARVGAALLFEDAEMAVVDKPAGLAVHSGSHIPFGVIEALAAVRPDSEWGLAHRLDRGTSGCLVVGKGPGPTRALQAAFREERIEKGYLALLVGESERPEMEVSAPLRRTGDGAARQSVVVDPEGGREAMTRFRTVTVLSGYTLVWAEPCRGRTHQIRAHARHAGLPIGGDPEYGDKAGNRALKDHGLDRIFLHSAKIGLPHPTSGEWLTFQAPLPTDLKAVLEALGAAGGILDNDD